MVENKENLKREIGIFGLSANLINFIVGAGIFTLPAIVAAKLGSASILAYLLCGLLITLIMLCFAEVGTKITTSGGAYTYIQNSFGPYFGFISAILFLLGSISADAAIANAMVDILGSFNPFLQTRMIKIFIFFILFTGLGYINVIGVKEGINLVKLITIIKLIPLLLLIFFAWKEVSLDNIAIDSPPMAIDLGQISLILFFAFVGVEGGMSVSGEVKNSIKTVPKAILISISVVMIIYILIQTISQGVLGSSLANFKENPLGEVSSHIFGPTGYTLVTIGGIIVMLGVLISTILSTPRVLFRITKDNILPFKLLAKVHNKYATPYISIIVYAGLSFLFASVGGFEQLAIIASASFLLIYLGVSLSVIKLRRTGNVNSNVKCFKIPGGYAIPILASLFIIWLLSNLGSNEFIGIGLVIFILSLIYLLMKRSKKT